MAKLYFIFSTMNSGKSLDLLKTAHNYTNQGKKILLFTTSVDSRNGSLGKDEIEGIISTRLGIKEQAYLIEKVDPFFLAKEKNPACVMVDEAQFLDENIVLKLVDIVDLLDIPVICYGLKNDFQNHLFSGSEALLIHADKIQEIKTVCVYCDNKATMNLRKLNNKPIFTGDKIVIDSESINKKIAYEPVCRKCYNIQKNKALI